MVMGQFYVGMDNFLPGLFLPWGDDGQGGQQGGDRGQGANVQVADRAVPRGFSLCKVLFWAGMLTFRICSVAKTD